MQHTEAWRLLELSPSPTVEQVKAAYRRRAKAMHPDLSLPGRRATAPTHFARLTAAYEVALAEAVAANRRGRRPLPESPPLSETPSRAEPTPPTTATPRSAPPQWHRRRTTESGSGSDAPQRATPGSTTYPDEPYVGDPEWAGADWVGANSGTYWTVNPKEYADPRRHGAGYRARGRRPVRREARSTAPPSEQAPHSTHAQQRGLFSRIAAFLARRGTISE